jgi:hypothetical protein
VKHWYTWISKSTSITGETLIYMNIKHYKYVWYSCISMFHQLYLQCLIFIYINVSPVVRVVFYIHVYQCFTSYICSVWYACISISHPRHVQLLKHWYRWISNTTHINGETLIYMNIKQYKYNWWNIDIHEYRTLHV